jgi:hypothetical protein
MLENGTVICRLSFTGNKINLWANNHDVASYWGVDPNIVGVPPLKQKDLLLRPPNSPFFVKPMTCLKFPFFFLISNEINLLQILYGHLHYLLFSLMNVKIIKFIQCGPYSINGPKFPKVSFFETLYIVIKHLVLVTLEHFIYISK